MRVIIDTNDLVSAAISGRKPEMIIGWILNHPNCEWIVSTDILAEYREVLSRSKIKLTEAERQQWFSLIENSTQVISVDINIDFPRDPKDAKFIACAFSSEADFFITGDSDFRDVQTWGKTLMISVSDFAELIGELG